MGTGKYPKTAFECCRHLIKEPVGTIIDRFRQKFDIKMRIIAGFSLFFMLIVPCHVDATYLPPNAPVVDGMAIHPVTGEVEPAYIQEGITYTQDTATGNFSGYLFRYEDATHLYFAFAQSVDLNDNTYGTNAIGWAVTGKGHTFKDLWSSDHAWVEMYNCSNQLVLHYAMDYANWNSTTGKLTTLGVTGGDGQMALGNAAFVDQVQTSLTWNFNHATPTWAGKTTTSPPRLLTNNYDAGTWVNPNTPWIYEVLYEWRVSKAAFGTSGFCKLKIMEVHNSPYKKGTFNPAPEPVVSVALTADPPAGTDLLYGDVIEYFVHYKNPGTATLTNVVITDPLVGDLEFVSAKNLGTYDPSTHTVEWDVGTLAPGASGTVSFFAAAKPMPGVSVVMNKAYLAATLPNGSFKVPTNTLYHPVLMAATLNAGLAAIPQSGNFVTQGQDLELILSIDTSGNLDATNTIAKLKLDPGLDSIVPLDVPLVSGGIYNPVNHDVTWNLGTLAPGTVLQLKVLTKVSLTTPVGTTLMNSAQVTSDVGVANPNPVFHPVVGPDFVTVDIALDCSPPCGQQVNPTQPVTYYLSFTTQGVANLTNAVVTMPVDPSLSQVVASNGGTYNGNNRVLTWNVGTVAPYTETTFEIDAKVASGAVDGTVITEIANIAATQDSATSDPVEYFVTIPPIVTPKIALSATPTSGTKVFPGAPIDLKINVAASGTTNLTNTIVKLKLDPNLVQIDPKLGTYVASTHEIVWTVGTVVPGITQSLFAAGVVKNTGTVPEGTVLTEQATLVATQGPAVSNPVTHVVQLPKAVTPTILLQSAPPTSTTVTPGQAITLYTTVGAIGTMSLTNAKATLFVDPTNLVSVSPQNGGVYLTGPPRVEWNLGSISPGTSMILTASGTVKTTAGGGTILVESAKLTGDQGSVDSNIVTHSVAVPNSYPTAVLSSVPPHGATVLPNGSLALKLDVKANGTKDLSNVVATMVLDPGVQFVSADAPYSYNSTTRTVTWTWSTQTKGTTKTVNVNATVKPDVLDNQVLIETASVTSTQGNASTIPVNHIVALPKAVSPMLTLWSAPVSGTFLLNDQFIYFYLLAEAIGNTNLTNAVVTLKLDSDMTKIRPKGDGVYDPVAHTISWYLGTMSPQNAMSLVGSGEFLPGLAEGTEIKTEAWITADQGFFAADPLFHYITVPKVVVPKAELFAEPPSGSKVAPNELVEFALHVTADGNTPLTNTIAQINVDPRFVITAISDFGEVIPGTNTVEWQLGDIPFGTTKVVQTSGQVIPDAVDNDVLITEAGVIADQGSVDTPNALHIVAVPKAVTPTLALDSVPPSGATVMPDDVIDLSVHVGAIGNTLLTNAEVTLVLADEFINISAPGGTVHTDVQPRTITWSLPTVVPLSTVTLPVTGTVSSDAVDGAVLVESASLESDQGSAEADPIHHVVTVPDAVIPVMGLQSIPESGSAVHPSDLIDLTIMVAALGNIPLTNATVTLVLDSWVDNVQPKDNGKYLASPAHTVVWTVDSILPDDVIGLHATVRVKPGAPEIELVHSASLSSDQGPAEALPVFHNVVIPLIVVPSAGLSADPPSGSTVAPTSAVSLAVTIGATGNTNLTGTVAKLLLDPLFEYQSSSDGGQFDPATHAVTWDVGVVSPGLAKVRTCQVNVSADAPDNHVLVDTATVTADQGAAAANPVEHTVKIPLVVSPTVQLVANPSTGSTVKPKDTIQLTVTAGAVGNTSLTDAVISLPLDPDVLFVEAGQGTYISGNHTIVWPKTNIDPSTPLVVTAYVKVNDDAKDTEILAHSAQVTATQGTAISDSVTHIVAVPKFAVPTIELDSVPPSGSTVSPASTINLVVKLGAMGNTGVTNAVATLKLDPKFVDPKFAHGGAYDATTHSVSWNVDTLTPGQIVLRSVSGTVDPNATDDDLLVETATVAADSGSATSNPVHHIVAIPKWVAPAITLSSIPPTGSTVGPNTPIDLFLNVTAQGNTALTDAVVTLHYDALLAILSPDNGAINTAQKTITWTLATLSPGDTASFLVKGITSSAAPDNAVLVETASVTATQGSANAAPVTHTIAIPKVVTPGIQLTADPIAGTMLNPNQPLALTLTVTANGNTDLTNVNVTLSPDLFLTELNAEDGGTVVDTEHKIIWTIPKVSPESPVVLHAGGVVDPAVLDKVWLKEQASLTSDQGPAVAAPIYHPVTLPAPVVDLALTLGAIPASGSVLQVTDLLILPLELTVAGNTASTNTQVILQVDPRLENVVSDPPATHDKIAHTVTWWLGDVEPGTAIPLEVTATVREDAPNGAKLIEMASAISDQDTAQAAPVHHFINKEGISVETTTELTQDNNGDGTPSTGDLVTLCVEVSNTGTTEWKDLTAVMTVEHETLEVMGDGCGMGGGTPDDIVWSLCCLPSGGHESRCCTFVVSPLTPDVDTTIDVVSAVIATDDTIVAEDSTEGLEFQWAPQVTSIVPTTLPLGYVGEVELFGEHFPADLMVEFAGGVVVLDVYVESVTHARVTLSVPMSQQLGLSTLLVGETVVEPQPTALVVSLPAPQIVSMSPMVLAPGETTTVTVEGNWLDSAVTLTTSAGEVSNVVIAGIDTMTFDILAPPDAQEITVSFAGATGVSVFDQPLVVYGPTQQSCVVVERLDQQQISITGYGFQGDEVISLGPGITVDALSVSDTVILASIQISETAPLGLCPLEVTSPTAGYSAILNDCVAVVNPEPIVDAMIPPAGAPGSVVTVTVLGDNLYAPIGASLEGLLITSIVPVDPTTALIEVFIPEWATIGGHDLTLSTQWGTAHFNNAFTVSTIYVESLTPGTGNVGETVQVDIVGSGFEAGMTLSFGEGIGVLPLIIDSPYTAKATITVAPDAAEGPRDAILQLQNQVWMVQDAFVVNNVKPIVTQIKPAVVSPGGVATINVVGTGFLPTSVVTIEGSQPISTLLYSGVLKPTVELPKLPGLYDVTVSNTNLSTTVTNGLTVYGATQCTGATLVQGEQAAILVSGFGFSYAPKATLHNKIVVNQVTKKSNTSLELSLSVAADAPIGTYPLRLDQSIGVLSATMADCVTVLPANGQAPAAPTVTELTPSTVTAGNKTDVFIKGTGFGVSPILDFGPEITITGQTTLSDTLLKATLATSSTAKPGPVDVTVETAAGEVLVPAGITIVQQPLTVTSHSPSLLTLGKDETITLIGTGLTSATSIDCGGAGKIFAQTVVGATKMMFGIKTTLTPGLYSCTLTNGGETITLPNALTVFGIANITPSFVGKGNTVSALLSGGLPNGTLVIVDDHIEITPGVVVGPYTTATISADYDAALGAHSVTAKLGKLTHTLSGALTITPGIAVVNLVRPTAMELNQAQEIEITGFNLDGCTATISGAITSGVVTQVDSTKLMVWAMSTEVAGSADLLVECPHGCLEFPGILSSIDVPEMPIPSEGKITITLPGTSANYPSFTDSMDIEVQASVTGLVLGADASILWYVDGILFGEQTDTKKITLANVSAGMHTITAVLVDKTKKQLPGKTTKATSKVTIGKPCTGNQDCDDGNSCSKEWCKAGICNYTDSDVFKAKFCCQSDIECGYAAKCKNNQCVSCEVDQDCFDGVACTIHKCNSINNTCVNKSLIGCCIVDSDCDDGNPCTKDSCADHQCAHSKESIACCQVAQDCDDGNPCTKDYCYKNECKQIDVPLCCTKDTQCSDNKECTADWCDPVTLRCDHKVIKECPCGKPGAPKCCTGNIDCFDGDGCTQDLCDVETGTCTNKPTWCCKNEIDCDDGIWCNVDACINGECRYGPNPLFDVPVKWGVMNECCIDDPSKAAKYASYLDCDDNDPCTLDICDPITQMCDHIETDDANCCTWPSECNDGDPATIDACVNAQCQFTVNDQYCETASECDDDHGCTVDICGSDNTCSHYLLDDCCISDTQCGDKNPCTLDICNQTTHKCENPPNPNCCYDHSECDDGDGCTADQCINHSCRHTKTPNCCATVADCANGPACTTASCIAGKCVFAPVANAAEAGCCSSHGDCVDNDPCTNDLCVLGKCVNKPSLSCCYTALDCNDNNSCTKDICVFGKCKNVASLGCCSSNTDCNDNNDCTDDTCVAGACKFTASQSCAEPLPLVSDYSETSLEESGWSYYHEGIDKPGPWVLNNGKAIFAPAKTAAPYRSYWVSPPFDATGAGVITAQFDLAWVPTGNSVTLSVKVRKTANDPWVTMAQVVAQDPFTKLWSIPCTTELANAPAGQVALVVDSSGPGGYQVIVERFVVDAGTAPTFPAGTTLPLMTVAVGGKAMTEVIAADGDGDLVTFSLLAAPGWASLKGFLQGPLGYYTQLLVQPPAGTAQGNTLLKIRATDGVLETDIQAKVTVY